MVGRVPRTRCPEAQGPLPRPAGLRTRGGVRLPVAPPRVHLQVPVDVGVSSGEPREAARAHLRGRPRQRRRGRGRGRVAARHRARELHAARRLGRGRPLGGDVQHPGQGPDHGRAAEGGPPAAANSPQGTDAGAGAGQAARLLRGPAGRGGDCARGGDPGQLPPQDQRLLPGAREPAHERGEEAQADVPPGGVHARHQDRVQPEGVGPPRLPTAGGLRGAPRRGGVEGDRPAARPGVALAGGVARQGPGRAARVPRAALRLRGRRAPGVRPPAGRGR
mmetsp:Transcript_29260/g.76641  ORF Transcript_29260/g.76641 Transcript_29260/m.76641 type:complete len:277 (+) Transcript_29260:888-1718(+)